MYCPDKGQLYWAPCKINIFFFKLYQTYMWHKCKGFVFLLDFKPHIICKGCLHFRIWYHFREIIPQLKHITANWNFKSPAIKAINWQMMRVTAQKKANAYIVQNLHDHSVTSNHGVSLNLNFFFSHFSWNRGEQWKFRSPAFKAIIWQMGASRQNKATAEERLNNRIAS